MTSSVLGGSSLGLVLRAGPDARRPRRRRRGPAPSGPASAAVPRVPPALGAVKVPPARYRQQVERHVAVLVRDLGEGSALRRPDGSVSGPQRPSP